MSLFILKVTFPLCFLVIVAAVCAMPRPEEDISGLERVADLETAESAGYGKLGGLGGFGFGGFRPYAGHYGYKPFTGIYRPIKPFYGSFGGLYKPFYG